MVPIRDRRERVRILTLKNFGWALLVLALGFFVVDAGLHLRRPSTDDYGRLYKREMTHPPVVASRAPAVVIEAQPIPEAPSADPFLMTSAVREQYLGAPPKLEPVPVVTTADTLGTASDTRVPQRVSPGEHVAIVGDGSGVSIQTSTRSTTPKLSGGIFR